MMAGRRFAAGAAAALLLCLGALAQAQVEREVEREAPAEREQWFREGRSVLGESAAALRYRAYQQKLTLRTARRVSAARAAQTVDAAQAGGTGPQWQNLGPAPLISDPSGSQSYGPVAGRVTSVVVDQRDPTGNTVYVGAAYGGVWRSTNAANSNAAAVTFTPLIEDQPTLAVGAIALKPDDSRVILVGTGEANFSGDSYYGLGILRSADGGASWMLISSADAGVKSFKGVAFASIVFSADDPNLIVAAASASGNGVTVGVDSSTNCTGATTPCTRGLYYSIDAGLTWSSARVSDSSGTPDGGSARSIVYNPAQHRFYAVLRGHGLYSSSDGQNWTRLANQPGSITLSNCPTSPTNLSGCPMGRGELALRPGRDEMYIWIVNTADADQGIYRTSDGGQTWVTVNEGGLTSCGDSDGCGTSQGSYNLYLAAVPRGNATDLYAGAVNVFKCSTAAAATPCSGNAWLNVTHVYGCSPTANPSHVHPDQHAADFSRTNPDIIYFGNDGGLYRTIAASAMTSTSCNASQPFDNLNASLGSLAQFVSMSVHPTDSTALLGGTQDNGSPSISSAAAGGNGVSWTEVNNGDGGFNQINASDGDEWFTSRNGVRLFRCTRGVNCSIADFQSIATASSLANDTAAFYPPFILDPNGGSSVLYGTCRVWSGVRSGGLYAWTAISNNLSTASSTACVTGNDSIRSVAAGGPVVNGTSRVIYAGTRNGAVWVTTQSDAGATSWIDRTGSVNSSGYTISDIYVDPRDASGRTAYLTVMGFGTGHVFRTVDAGATWSNVSGDLPDSPANTVIVDPLDNAIVYVGTDVGVFMTRNGGANWTEYGAGLPNTSVTRLRLFSPNCGGPNVLRASTYGRGVWQVALASVPSAADFTFSVDTPTMTVYPSRAATYGFSTRAFNGYSGSLAISCGPGAPASCGQASLATSSCSTAGTFTASDTAVGNYNFDVVATGPAAGAPSGSLSHSVPVVLRVTDFGIGTSSFPPVLFAGRGATTPASVFVGGSLLSLTDHPLTVQCSSALAGLQCAPAAPTVGSDFRAVLNLTVANSVALGEYVTVATLTATDALANVSHSRAMTLEVVDYQISTSTPSRTVTAGASASYSLTLAPEGTLGFPFNVQLSCSGLPDLASCSFDRNPIAPNSQGTTVAMTVSTTARGTTQPGTGVSSLRGAPLLRHLGGTMALAPVVGIVLASLRRRRSAATLTLLPVVLMLAVVGCGGGRNATTSASTQITPVQAPGTPVGTYQVTVTGASNGATHSQTVTLVVQ